MPCTVFLSQILFFVSFPNLGKQQWSCSEELLPMRTRGHKKPGMNKRLGFSGSASYWTLTFVTNRLVSFWAATSSPARWYASVTRDLLGIFFYFLGFPPASYEGSLSLPLQQSKSAIQLTEHGIPYPALAVWWDWARGSCMELWMCVYLVESVDAEKEEPVNIPTWSTCRFVPPPSGPTMSFSVHFPIPLCTVHICGPTKLLDFSRHPNLSTNLCKSNCPIPWNSRDARI